jgi:hypothetical protein
LNLLIKTNLYQKLVKISNNKYSLSNSNLQKLIKTYSNKNYLLNLENLKYLIKVNKKIQNFIFNLLEINNLEF